MHFGGILLAAIDAVAREATLFAAIWFLVGGIDDLLVDLVFAWRLLRNRRGAPPAPVRDYPPAGGRYAIFVPAWDEQEVIGGMLRNALAALGREPDYRLYVGTYPNDPATIAAVAEVAGGEPRIRLVIGPSPGPTTKADCLNVLWHALQRDGWAPRAVILHDAEDWVHADELRVFERHLGTHDVVQLPVLPLAKPGSRLVAGHYLDEFAEAHGKSLVVRQTLGAGMPLAGTGCAIRREMLTRIAEARGGDPFDATSLTEDYELGLTIAAIGGRAMLARVPERRGGLPVAVRAWFPDRFDAAVRQKARWMTGIALAGWDRIGWARPLALSDHWMRMRDRRAILAIPVLATAYGSLLAWSLSLLGHFANGSMSPALGPAMGWLLIANLALLLWRLAIRATFVWRAYGPLEAMWSVPRVLVGNFIALFAARRAALLYFSTLIGSVPIWDKTRHQFPDPATMRQP